MEKDLAINSIKIILEPFDENKYEFLEIIKIFN